MSEQVQTSVTDSTETKICLICHKAVNGSLKRCPDDGGELVNMKQDRLIGEVFANRYKILSIIGQGGMSTVYKAQHTYMDRVVAVKLLHPHLVSDPISIQRFQQEAKAAASLAHANVITVYDFGVTEDGLAFLVMDYLEGPSLGDLLDRTGPVPPDEALDIFRQLLKGLCHAHRKGVIHRDLKPRNLVLAVDEDASVQVKIVDFGIAKMIPQDGGESQHLTQTGEVFGSPIYMSPEQCSGQQLDLRSDIYSMGCVMFEVLTGSPPFLGKNAVETMSMHVNDDPPDFKDVAPAVSVSPELEEIVLGCLQKDRKKRYQTANEILEILPLPGGQAKQSQSGTVAMKLGDILTATTPMPAQSRSKVPRRGTKKFIKMTSSALATIFGIAFFALFGLVAFFPFVTAEDPGSPLAKMWWQFEIWTSDRMIESQFPGVAVSVLKHAVQDAKNLGGPNSKRVNYDVQILTLSKLADAYLASGKSAEQEDVVQEIVVLDRTRYANLAQQMIADMGDAQAHFDDIKKKGGIVQKHLAEPRLNWAGSARSIVEIARRLDATYSYGLELELLNKAAGLLRSLYGQDFIGLADVYEQTADCMQNQDRTDNIEPFYENIKRIRWKHAESSGKDPNIDPDYIRAELHLGQWQRDRGQLDKAYVTLSNAVKHAKKSSAIHHDQLAEYYESFADLLDQRHDSQEAASQRDFARVERKAAEDQCQSEISSHKGDATQRHR